VWTYLSEITLGCASIKLITLWDLKLLKQQIWTLRFIKLWRRVVR